MNIAQFKIQLKYSQNVKFSVIWVISMKTRMIGDKGHKIDRAEVHLNEFSTLCVLHLAIVLAGPVLGARGTVQHVVLARRTAVETGLVPVVQPIGWTVEPLWKMSRYCTATS